MESPSVSTHSLGSRGNWSCESGKPSLSSSPSTASHEPSRSVSVGTEAEMSGSDPHVTSVASAKPSPSSSSSELSPTPSESVSNHSEGSSGKASSVSR